MNHMIRSDLLGPLSRPFECKNANDGEQVAETGEIKKAIDGLARTFETFKEKNDAHIEEVVKKRFDDVVRREEVDRINAAIDEKLKKRDDEILDLKRQAVFSKAHDRSKDLPKEMKAYSDAFGTYIRKGESYMPAPTLAELQAKAADAIPEMKAMLTQSSADGGFTVIPQWDQTLVEIQSIYSPVRSIATVQQIGAGQLEKVVNLRGTVASWSGETDLRTQQTPNSRFAKLEFVPGELIAQPATTLQTLEDSFLNIEQFIADEAGLAFAIAEGQAFISGDGSKKPKGFLAENRVPDASHSWGNIGYIATGASGGFLPTQTSPSIQQGADALFDVIGALKYAYRRNAVWTANRRVVASLRKIKTAFADYLWAPGLQSGQPDSLAGYPLVEMEDMPDIAANSFSLAFGDFKQGYVIVDRIGTSVLRDPYTQTPYVLFKTRKRVGGGVQNYEALKLLRFATS